MVHPQTVTLWQTYKKPSQARRWFVRQPPSNAIVPMGAAVTARPRDCSRAVDDARRFQSGVERDPQQALNRSRKRRKAEAPRGIELIANA